jgi:isopenicillin N synthase-like dioxygenase
MTDNARTARTADPFAEFPVIDLALWRDGDDTRRAAVEHQVDHALRSSGFLLVTNHGIDAELARRLNETSRAFCALPVEVKERYLAQPGGTGWIPSGVEANGYTSGEATPADLKEALSFGPVHEGAVTVTSAGLVPCTNVYPAEAEDIEAMVRSYIAEALHLANELFELFAAALGLDPDHFAKHCTDTLHTLVVTWYPSLTDTGTPIDGQYRIGPHADFGTITILDREPTDPGLQVQLPDGSWVDAPFVPGSLTINGGDLLSRWTGGRWRSNMHRVPAPTSEHPEQDRLSLVLFLEADADAIITPIPPPVGGGQFDEPVSVIDFLHQKFREITLSS